MIPKTGWRDMESAPKDGTIIFVVSHLYNKDGNPRQVQAAQWLCESGGTKWDWRRPWSGGWKVYADGWMHVEEFYAAVQGNQPVEIDDETPAGMSALNAPPVDPEPLDFDL